MKKYLLICLVITIVGCSSSDDGNDNLPNIPVNITLNLDLNSNFDLLAPGGYNDKVQGGIEGIIVYNLNGNQFLAYDKACPHKPLGECNPMVVVDSQFMECTCDGTRFSLALQGQPQNDTPYAARQYRVVRNGNILTITNF